MAKRARSAEAAETLRGAVDRTFQATVGQTQVPERAQELVDELTTAAGRVRGVLDDLRLATGEDVKRLRAEVRRLERRVAALEKASRPGSPASKRSKPAASKRSKPSARSAGRGAKTGARSSGRSSSG